MMIKDLVVIPLTDAPALDIDIDQIKQETGDGDRRIVKAIRLLDADQFQVIYKKIDHQHDQDAHHMCVKYPAGETEDRCFAGILNSSLKHCTPPEFISDRLHYSIARCKFQKMLYNM